MAPVSAAPSVRSLCLHKILYSIKLSFHIAPEYLNTNERSLFRNCTQLLQFITSHLLSFQQPNSTLDDAKQLLLSSHNVHCCTEGPLFSSFLFNFGRYILPPILEQNGATDGQIPSLVIELLWAFLTPWIGNLNESQLQRPKSSDPKFSSCHLPTFAVPPILPTCAFFRIEGTVEEPQEPSAFQRSIIKSAFQTIFWSFIGASLLPLSSSSSSPSMAPFLTCVTADEFKSFIQLREIIQDILRFHLKSSKVYCFTYSQWIFDLMLSDGLLPLDLFRNVLTTLSKWPILPSLKTLIGKDFSLSEEDITIQYYELSLHFLSVVAEPQILSISTDAAITKFQHWCTGIVKFALDHSEVFNNCGVLKRFLLTTANYSPLLSHLPQICGGCIITCFKSLLIGQHDNQYLSLRSKEDHAGAVALMKLCKSASKQNSICSLSSTSIDLSNVSRIIQSCFEASYILGPPQVLQQLLSLSQESNTLAALLKMEFPQPSIPMVLSSYPIVFASWGILCRLFSPSSLTQLLTPFFRLFVHCLLVYKNAVTDYSQRSPSPQLSNDQIVFLCRRLKVVAKSAEALVAAAAGDLSSLVLDEIGMISTKGSNSFSLCQANNQTVVQSVQEVFSEHHVFLISMIPFWSAVFRHYYDEYKQPLKSTSSRSCSSDMSLRALESIASLISCGVRINCINMEQLLLFFSSKPPSSVPLLPFLYRPLASINLNQKDIVLVANKVCTEALHSATYLFPSLTPTEISSPFLDGLDSLASFLIKIDIIRQPSGFSILSNWIMLNTLVLRSAGCLGGLSLLSLQLLTDYLAALVSTASNPLLTTVEASHTAMNFLNSELSAEHLFWILSSPPVFSAPQPTYGQILLNSLQSTTKSSLFCSSSNDLFNLQTDAPDGHEDFPQTILHPPRSPTWVDALSSSILQTLSSEIPLAAASANLCESLRLLFTINSSEQHLSVDTAVNPLHTEKLLLEAAWLVGLQLPIHTTPSPQWKWCILNTPSNRHFLKEVVESQRAELQLTARRSQLKIAIRKFCGRGSRNSGR